MKFQSLFTLAISLPMAFACKKDAKPTGTYETAEFHRDCTGAYLRWKDKDYKICNAESVASFTGNTSVEVIFHEVNNCTGTGNFQITCDLYHPYVNYIEVEAIK
ncbi:hypothetical protein [Flavihumibacter petaseus]|uniref:Uncharacterized protein n=1 Tax=Flavihumibacter petaseus NBRC 106054 TaxID=1220578 RepID=A0A0E9N026_9BACT|nr:hypothetical protein [Flavihumibacter petaseus]GAO42730.1 hypothetical protein FPE01S_01_17480 [Flavihumibacter petaseus NBRC 106054]